MTIGLNELSPIRVGFNEQAAFRDRLEAELLKDLRAENEQSHNENLALEIKDHNQNLIAGLDGALSYGWLHIHMLWVEESRRRKRLGANLVQSAQDWAKKHGAHAVWLDTSSPKARWFYEALGFEVFAEIGNGEFGSPKEHQRWMMKSWIV